MKVKTGRAEYQSAAGGVRGSVSVARAPEPGPVVILHNDYKLDNAMISGDGKVMAVFDWDMATRGEALVDLGTLLAYWPDPAAPTFPIFGEQAVSLAPLLAKVTAFIAEEVVPMEEAYHNEINTGDRWAFTERQTEIIETLAGWLDAGLRLRGPLHDVAVAGDMIGMRREEPMRRLAGTALEQHLDHAGEGVVQRLVDVVEQGDHFIEDWEPALVALAKKAGVTEAYFDRGGFLFHGKVKAVADAAREGGLKI